MLASRDKRSIRKISRFCYGEEQEIYYLIISEKVNPCFIKIGWHSLREAGEFI
jgi:hypothetical protein